MADAYILARSLADLRDAVARIQSVLPADLPEFERDRTVREVVVLNLFVALQNCLTIATHWLADARLDVPPGYREAMLALRDRGVLEADLSERLAAAAGLRNLIAHRYGVLDWKRVHEIAATRLSDLLAFADQIERASQRNAP